jgi:hypothetical protein
MKVKWFINENQMVRKGMDFIEPKKKSNAKTIIIKDSFSAAKIP